MADRRFETSFKQLPGSDEPGLVLGDDDVVYLIKPDGTRVEVGSGGALGALLLEAGGAGEKVSDLGAVTDVQDADEFVLARAGGNNKIDGASLKSAFGGSGALLLGPYIVNFDTAGVNAGPFFVPGSPAMADGFWITDTLVEFLSTWGDGSDPGTFTMQTKLEVSPSEDVTNSEWINRLDPYDGSQNIMDDGLANGTGLSAEKRQFRLDTARWSVEAGITITSAKLSMEIYSNRDPFTTGQIRVWALGTQT